MTYQVGTAPGAERLDRGTQAIGATGEQKDVVGRPCRRDSSAAYVGQWHLVRITPGPHRERELPPIIRREPQRLLRFANVIVYRRELEVVVDDALAIGDLEVDVAIANSDVRLVEVRLMLRHLRASAAITARDRLRHEPLFSVQALNQR